jgi:hypothetical protein
MRRSERDEIISWMRRHAWDPTPIPAHEVEQHKLSALEMRQRIQALYEAAGKTRLNKIATQVGRGAGLLGLGVLVVDLLTTGGAVGALTWVGSTATAVGGGKEIYDIYEGRIRVNEKAWILERRRDIDQYLKRLDQSL